MRLLQAMAGAATGGAETFFTRLAVALQARGVDQHLLIRPDAAREAALRGCGAQVTTARFGGPFDVATRRALRRRIGSFAPDIVLSWMNRATSFCPRPDVMRRFVHVGTPRGYYDPKYYRACDHLVVTTDDLARFYVERGWAADRITRIANFVPDAAADPVPRAALDTPDDAPLLLALGRLHRNKAFDTLLAALAHLPEHFLWLAGDGPEDAALRAEAARLGVAPRVRFLGWRDDAPALFAASDVLVCPSRHEPFGNIVIEAWLHRVPIVAAASEGPSSLIEDGASGLLTPVDDAAALAAAIRRLADEPGLGARLAAAGRAAWEAGYTEQAVVPRYLDLFDRLAG